MISVTADELPRVMQCIGSRNMAAVLPPEYNAEARDEGTAAHYMAGMVFGGATFDQLVDQQAPNGFFMTSEMADHVAEYLGALDCGEIEVVTSFAGNGWEVRGRADHIKYDPSHVIGYINGGNGNVLEDTIALLTIDDFKYGWRIVEPDHNWTLIAHAIGYCIKHAITPDLIVLRIHQPRPYHPNGKMREWRITYDQLLRFHAQINAHLTDPSDELRTGPACFKCHAFHGCPAAAIMQSNAIDAVYTTAFNDDLSPQVLASELDTLRRAKEVIEARVTAVEELAAHKAKNGAVIPGYGLETRYGNTSWKKGISAQALTVASGIDCTKPGMITPAEFKRRGGSQKVYDSLTERPMIGTKLVRSDATRRAEKLLNK